MSLTYVPPHAPRRQPRAFLPQAPRFRAIVLPLAAAAIALLTAAPARAAKIELEVAMESGAPLTAAQQWNALLVELNVDNIRIRSARAGDAPGIERRGAEADPVYAVTGVLSARNELTLPGGRFSARDRGRLAAWLNKLRSEGPPGADGEGLPFGLSAKQLAAAHEDLSQPVAFSTQGKSLEESVQIIAAELRQPLTIDRAAAGVLAAAEPILDEAQGVSSGTGLAYLLRAEGLALVPQLNAKRQVEYRLQVAAEGQTVWPIGWPLKDMKAADVAPGMYEWLNVELEDISLAEALAAISERLEMPILYDRHAMIDQDIEPAEITVELPSSRSIYHLILRKLLHQGQLTSEVRLDEADRPLLWVTPLKKKKAR